MDNSYTNKKTTLDGGNTTTLSEQTVPQQQHVYQQRCKLLYIVLAQGLIYFLYVLVQPEKSPISHIIILWGIVAVVFGIYATKARPLYYQEAIVGWYQSCNENVLPFNLVGIVEHLYHGVGGFHVNETSSFSYYRPNLFFFILGIVIALLEIGISILAILRAKAYQLELLQYPPQALCIMIESVTAYQPTHQCGPHQQPTEHVV